MHAVIEERLAPGGLKPPLALLAHLRQRQLRLEWHELVARLVGGFVGRELQAQKERLLGERSQRTNRPELKEQYGFDTKFAYHAIRLGIQGIELLTEGEIRLPMAEPAHTWLKDLRVGKYTLEEAIEHIEDIQYILQHLALTADLPEKADYRKIDDWLVNMYQSYWAGHASP